MLTDYNTVGDQATTKILAARKRKARELSRPFPVFRVLRLNWQTAYLTDMISWCDQVTKSPVTKLMSDNEIARVRDRPLELHSFPRQLQSAERCIELVTEACQNVRGYENRHVLSRQAAWKGRKRLNTKADNRT